MKRFLIIVLLLCGPAYCLAQDTFTEFQGYYQRVQGFDFNSGTSQFAFKGASMNGGGFGFVFGLSPKFGFFQRTSFFGGVEQSGLTMRVISEVQGVQLMREAGPFDFYAKGGLGFNRWVFEEFGSTTGVDYGMALVYGGGAEAKLKEGTYLVLEATRMTTGLPNISGLPGRSKWDSSWLITTGIAFRF